MQRNGLLDGPPSGEFAWLRARRGRVLKIVLELIAIIGLIAMDAVIAFPVAHRQLPRRSYSISLNLLVTPRRVSAFSLSRGMRPSEDAEAH
jgi:hypothetical protein